jgi:hypothetical protein
MRATRPPVDYLAKCSKSALESLELSRLNVAANLRKQFHQTLSELIENEVDARLARAVLDWRRGQHSLEPDSEVPLLPCSDASAASRLSTPEQLSIAFESFPANCTESHNSPNIEPAVPPAHRSVTLSPPPIPQSRQISAARLPLLARAAAAIPNVVETLAGRGLHQEQLRPRSAGSGAAKELPRRRAFAANSVPATVAHNANHRMWSLQTSFEGSSASLHLVPVLLGAAITFARFLA